MIGFGKIRRGAFHDKLSLIHLGKIYEGKYALVGFTLAHWIGIGLFIEVKALVVVIYQDSIPPPGLDCTGNTEIGIIVLLVLVIAAAWNQMKDVIGMLLAQFLLSLGIQGVVGGTDHEFHVFYQPGIISRSHKGEYLCHGVKFSLLIEYNRLYNIYISSVFHTTTKDTSFSKKKGSSRIFFCPERSTGRFRILNHSLDFQFRQFHILLIDLRLKFLDLRIQRGVLPP
jgi:hypothetical protein